MKTHTSNFKNEIKEYGREIDSKITYMQNGVIVELGNEELNSVTPHYEGAILKSVMKQLDIDSNVEIPVGTIVHYDFGVKIGDTYDYITFGNYVVKDVEKQEDKQSYKITCYDKMLYSMKEYENMNITYPITIRNYINTICQHLGLTFKDANNTFANYDKQIPFELYLSYDEETGIYSSLDYTFRDVLDELAQVTASTICINEDDDQLEIRYITDTQDTIDEEYLKDVNVNFGEQYGPINMIALARAGGSDVIHYPSAVPQNPNEIKIEDNQIMNFNDRDTYLPDIYNKLNGLQYYINDFSSTGICYYNICDRYNITIGENTYSCVMFNDSIEVTQGLQENIYTDLPEESETDYTKSDTTDQRINRAYIMVNKQNQTIEALAEQVQPISATKAGVSAITLENAYEGSLHYLEITGDFSLLFPATDLYPSNTLYPLDSYLIVDEEKYHLDIPYLRYMSEEICDKWICEEGKQRIERKVGVDSQGNYYQLSNPYTEEKEDLLIQVKSDSTISMESFNNIKLRCVYLLQNDYTDTFAQNVDLISRINLSPGEAQIEASKVAKIKAKNIELEGYTTINGNFGVDLEGNMFANNGNFSGNIFLEDGNKVIGGQGIMTNMQFIGTAYNTSQVANTEGAIGSTGGGFLGISGDNFERADNKYHYYKTYHACQVYIPKGFTVEKAYVTVIHSPVSYSYSNTSGNGYVRNMRCYNITGEFGVSAFIDGQHYSLGNTPTLNTSTEISNAFGSSGKTFSSTDTETVTSNDISRVFTEGGNYTIAVATGNTPGAETSSINYSRMYPYIGFVTMFVNIIGYMTMKD